MLHLSRWRDRQKAARRRHWQVNFQGLKNPMLFWIIAALLTLGACLAVLVPLMRARREAVADTDFDLAVYQDQLAELDRDMARGVIDSAEAVQARAEIGRRILKAADSSEAHTRRISGRGGLLLATAAVFSLPFVSWGIYAATGSPHLQDQPLYARADVNREHDAIGQLVTKAETHLSANPEDGRGWDVLAPIYYRMGRYADAAVAYGNAIRLLGASEARESGLGEALAANAGGLVTAEARAAFERTLAINPANTKARYLLASALAQEGKVDDARRSLLAMRDDLPMDSPWRPAVAQALAELDTQVGRPGPTAQDVEAAGSMSDDDRAQMIENMVAGLDERLKANPQDLEGWQRLLQSYAVLGRADAARDALLRGLEALGRDSDAGRTLASFATERGIEEVN
jgi:cytochrome c-type biogenesis protein CcmH